MPDEFKEFFTLFHICCRPGCLESKIELSVENSRYIKVNRAIKIYLSNKWSIWGGVKSLKLSKIILTFLSKSKYNHVQKFEKRDANDQNCIAFLYWLNCLSYNSVGYKKSQHSGKMRIFMGEYNLNLLILQLWVISSNYYKKSIKISVLMCPNN